MNSHIQWGKHSLSIVSIKKVLMKMLKCQLLVNPDSQPQGQEKYGLSSAS